MWGWWRVRRGWARRLVGEVPLWSLSALPFAAWMVRNRLVSEAVVGTHTQASRNTFWEGLSALLNQTSQVLVPAVGPLPTIAASETSSADVVLQFGLQLAIIGILVLPGRRLWQIYRRRGQPLALPPSPVVALPGAFVGLYVVVQPFVSFRPMDYRDSTTLMALLQPLLIAVIVRVLQRRAGPILGGYAALNLFIVVVPVLLFGVPRVITFFPPRVHDFAERSAGLYYYQHRVPGWLLVTPIRMSLVPRFHPQVAAFLADVNGPDTVVIGNIGHVLFYYEGQAHVPWRVFENRPNYQGVYDWLEVGQCQSQHNVILLVFRSGVENIYADWVVPAIAEKCPGLEPELVGDVLVYRLPRLE
jgi:hypothetical protein